jgi:hypothetical protein
LSLDSKKYKLDPLLKRQDSDLNLDFTHQEEEDLYDAEEDEDDESFEFITDKLDPFLLKPLEPEEDEDRYAQDLLL